MQLFYIWYHHFNFNSFNCWNKSIYLKSAWAPESCGRISFWNVPTDHMIREILDTARFTQFNLELEHAKQTTLWINSQRILELLKEFKSAHLWLKAEKSPCLCFFIKKAVKHRIWELPNAIRSEQEWKWVAFSVLQYISLLLSTFSSQLAQMDCVCGRTQLPWHGRS